MAIDTRDTDAFLTKDHAFLHSYILVAAVVEAAAMAVMVAMAMATAVVAVAVSCVSSCFHSFQMISKYPNWSKLKKKDITPE